MTSTDEDLFWDLIAELRAEDPRVEEGTIMGGRCARVSGEFLGLVDFKGSGLVLKLPADRVAELIATGHGEPFAPAGKVSRSGWRSRYVTGGAPCSARASRSSPPDRFGRPGRHLTPPR